MRLFDFEEQKKIGRRGALVIKRALERVYHERVEDYAENREMQRRGIDLYSPTLGYIECKMDMHDTETFFFEVKSGEKAGNAFSSRADWFAIYYPKHNRIFLLSLPSLQQWLAENYTELEKDKKTVHSKRGTSCWQTEGFSVPWKDVGSVMKEIDP